MSIIDISEKDKTYFKCYKFEDSSIYYGEVALIDDKGTVIEDVDAYHDDKAKLKNIRHGFGVQLFGVNELNCLSKYEGEWKKDKKNGIGNCYFSDGSIYEGCYVDDHFDGHGKYCWSTNDVYIGEWKCSRMEGDGEFKHNDGHILKGKFRNNYYLDSEVKLLVILTARSLYQPISSK